MAANGGFSKAESAAMNERMATLLRTAIGG